MVFFVFFLPEWRMAVSGAMQRITGAIILLQGGIAFLLDAPDAQLNVRMSRVQAAGIPHCENFHMPDLCSGRSFFSDYRRQIRMNRGFPPLPFGLRMGNQDQV
jgi:hypothetical protein